MPAYRFRLAAAAALGLALAVPGLPAAAGSGVFVQQALNASAAGAVVTATATVSAPADVAADRFGICARSPSGANLDFTPTRDVTITAAGTTITGVKTLTPGGPYTYWPCVHAGTSWYDVGEKKQLTVAPAAPAADPTTGAPHVGPLGVPGTWKSNFRDDFTTLSTRSWLVTASGRCPTGTATGCLNQVTVDPKLAKVSNGVLQLSSADYDGDGVVDHGAMIRSGDVWRHPADPTSLDVGEALEFRARFRKNDGAGCAGWSALWATDDKGTWPAAGEEDVAETLGQPGAGVLTANYHWGSDSSAANYKKVSVLGGSFDDCGTWRTFSVVRGTTNLDYYWDGVKIGSVARTDDGGPQAIVANVGGTTDPGVNLEMDSIEVFSH